MSGAFAEAAELIEPVEGWLSLAQAAELHRAAAAAGGPVVEIGSFRGRSTIVLAHAAPEDVEIVAVDPHLGSDRGPQEIAERPDLGAADVAAFRANLTRAGVAARVRHVRRRSAEALGEAPGRIGLLYVDGAHRYGPARDDLARWGARVAPGGTLLVHDAFSSVGVTLAILRVLSGRREWRYRGRTGSLARFDRDGRGGARDALRQAGEIPWFARNVVIKVLILARLGALTRLLGHRGADWPY